MEKATIESRVKMEALYVLYNPQSHPGIWEEYHKAEAVFPNPRRLAATVRLRLRLRFEEYEHPASNVVDGYPLIDRAAFTQMIHEALALYFSDAL